MSDFDARMAGLRARFAARVPEERARIARGLAAPDWSDLREACHGLSGRAGMFGHAALGDAARALEEAIDADAEEGERRRLGEELIAALDRAAS